MKIRKATKKDLKQLAKIMKEEFSKRPFNEKWTTNSSLKRIKEDYNKGYLFYVSEFDGKIAGFIDFDISTLGRKLTVYVYRFVVMKNFQRKGIGKALLERVESKIKIIGGNEIFLSTHKKSKALSFYKKLGYKKEEDYIEMFKKIK